MSNYKAKSIKKILSHVEEWYYAQRLHWHSEKKNRNVWCKYWTEHVTLMINLGELNLTVSALVYVVYCKHTRISVPWWHDNQHPGTSHFVGFLSMSNWGDFKVCKNLLKICFLKSLWNSISSLKHWYGNCVCLL